MISVVMATYNGEKFIEEQLMSIYNQTLQPDEVIIQDDCSSDNTVNLIKKFISEKHLDKWKLLENAVNIGYSANFTEALMLAKGDIIFLADQDDIWYSEKIMKMSTIIKQNSNIMLLASNVDPFYEGISPQKVNYEKFINKIVRIKNKAKWIKPARPGCSMCFRRELLSEYKKYWFNGYPHDCLLWGIAVMSKRAFIYNRKTIKFRRHDNNASSRTEKFVSNRVIAIEKEIDIIDNYLNVAEDNSNKDCVINQRALYFSRVNAIKRKDIVGILKLLVKIRYYPRFRFWLTDLLYCLR